VITIYFIFSPTVATRFVTHCLHFELPRLHCACQSAPLVENDEKCIMWGSFQWELRIGAGMGSESGLGLGAQCVQVACGINHACWPNDLPPLNSNFRLQNTDDKCDHTWSRIKRGSNEGSVPTQKTIIKLLLL